KRDWSSLVLSCYLITKQLVFFFSSRRRHTRSKRDWSTDVCSSDLNPVKSAIQYIQLNYMEQLSLQEISEKVYLSPSYFSKLFKEDRKSVVEGKSKELHVIMVSKKNHQHCLLLNKNRKRRVYGTT